MAVVQFSNGSAKRAGSGLHGRDALKTMIAQPGWGPNEAKPEVCLSRTWTETPDPEMCLADFDIRRFATVTPPKRKCLAWQPSRRPGNLLSFGPTPIKPERRLALPNAQPSPPMRHTVRDSVARSVLGRVSTSPRGSRPTPQAPPTNPDSPLAFQWRLASRWPSTSEGTR